MFNEMMNEIVKGIILEVIKEEEETKGVENIIVAFENDKTFMKSTIVKGEFKEFKEFTETENNGELSVHRDLIVTRKELESQGYTEKLEPKRDFKVIITYDKKKLFRVGEIFKDDLEDFTEFVKNTSNGESQVLEFNPINHKEIKLRGYTLVEKN